MGPVYRYFRLDEPKTGSWPSDHVVKVGTIIRVDLRSHHLPLDNVWNAETKDWVFANWTEVSDPAQTPSSAVPGGEADA